MAIFTAIVSIASSIVGIISTISGFIGGLGAIGQLALGAALSFVSNSLFGRTPSFQNDQTQYQAVINQAAAPRRRGYGRSKVGGVRAFYDSKDGTLYQIVMMHQGEIDAFEVFYIGDQIADLTGLGQVQTPPILLNGIYHAAIFPHTGSPMQTADPLMVADWAEWTTDHRLRGIAYVTAVFFSPAAENYLQVFPQGYNTPVMAIARLSRVLDTRTNTTAWSENPALCLADYLTHPDGYGRLTYADLDTASWNAMADLCDQAVDLAAGGVESRYRVSGMYELTDRPADVIQRMLACCDGELFTTRQGLLGIRGGKWDAPTVTINADDILGHDMEEGANALDRFNQLKIVYTDPNQDYQSTEAQAWDDLADQSERGVQTQDMTVEMCPSPSQARRLAKIRMAKENPRWSGTIRTNLAGLKARGERTITLVLPELNIDTSFLIGSHNLILDNGIPVACEMQVISMTADAYAWDEGTEEGESPPIPVDTAPDLTLNVPHNVVLAQETRGGVEVVTATCDAPTRPDAQLEGQISIASLMAWETMNVAAGMLVAVSGAVGPEDYVVRLRFRFGGAVGGWTTPEPITVT